MEEPYKDVGLESLHRHTNRKQEEPRRDECQHVHQGQVPDLDVQHLAAPHLGELVRDFLKGKITSVDPPFSLPHQRRNVLHRVNKRVGIGQEHQVVPVLVYTHTKDSILSQVHVAFVHELLVSLFFTGALLEQGVRNQNSQ